jgi:hypothetical protein
MIQNISQLLVASYLTIVSLSPACAEGEGRISLRFLAFPQTAEPEPVELVVGENGKTIFVDTPGHEISKTYDVPAMTNIVVGKTGEDSEGKPSFQAYGSANAIAAREQIIVLIRKGEANSDGFVVLPQDGNLEHFTGASYLFINASSYSIAGTIGNQQLKLESGKRVMLKPKADFEGGVCQVTFSYLRSDKWKMFYDTRWPANDKIRNLVFFYQNPKNGRIGISPITDIVIRREDRSKTEE